MEKIYKHILGNINNGNVSKSMAVQLIKMIKEVEKKTIKDHEDIAIIGMAVQLPMANDCDELWEFISSGKDSFREFPAMRKKR
jgi:hypothetical protein